MQGRLERILIKGFLEKKHKRTKKKDERELVKILTLKNNYNRLLGNRKNEKSRENFTGNIEKFQNLEKSVLVREENSVFNNTCRYVT